jgi:hypothetical protein
MINEINNYVTNLGSLVELPLRRSIQRLCFYSAMYCDYFVTLSEAKGYSPFTIDHSRL